MDARCILQEEPEGSLTVFSPQGLASSETKIQRPSKVPRSWSEGRGVEDGAGVAGSFPGLGQSGRKASGAEGHKPAAR